MEKVHNNTTFYFDDEGEMYYSKREFEQLGSNYAGMLRKNTRMYRGTWNELTEFQKENVRAFLRIDYDKEMGDPEWYYYLFDLSRRRPLLAYQSDKDMKYTIVSGWEKDKGIVKFE